MANKESESEQLQEEVGAIEAIYPECIKKLAPSIYKFKVPQHEHIEFQMTFPTNYPNEKPCVLDVISLAEGYDDEYLMELFNEVLDSIFHKGDVAIFDLFTELDQVLWNGDDNDVSVNDEHWTADDGIRGVENEMDALSIKPVLSTEGFLIEEQSENIDDHNDYANYVYDEEKEKARSSSQQKSSEFQKRPKSEPLEGWTITDPIVDRKSTFASFAREVHSVEEAYKYLALLMEDRKVARASHAMRAWRIKDDEGTVTYQDCDDDGETAAGGRMLHLLTIMDAWNVMVVCCRWFGGVHIGPDRFKHINSSTREAVIKGGFVTENDNNHKKQKKSKSKK